MDEKNIPPQRTGGHSDTVADADFKTEAQAREAYAISRARLLDVNHWREISVGKLAEFQITDSAGRPAQAVSEGCYFRIGIPGPDNPEGDGCDWVRVLKMEETQSESRQTISIVVHPAPCPTSPEAADAHFFDGQATSTFLVQRDGLHLSAEVHGRNEEPNTEGTGPLAAIRNVLVAFGAIFLGSKLQWKSLVEGIICREV